MTTATTEYTTAFDDRFRDQIALGDDALALLVTEGHTSYTFADEPVTEEKLRAIYEIIKLGPTALNSQPLRITWLLSKPARERLLPHMSGNNAPKTAAAPATAILSFDRNWHEHLPSTFAHMDGAREMFAAQPELRDGTGNGSGHMQVGYFIHAVRAVGLAAGPMTGFDAEGVNAEFFPEDDQRVMVIANVGKPGEGAYRPRLPRLGFETANMIL